MVPSSNANRMLQYLHRHHDRQQQQYGRPPLTSSSLRNQVDANLDLKIEKARRLEDWNAGAQISTRASVGGEWSAGAARGMMPDMNARPLASYSQVQSPPLDFTLASTGYGSHEYDTDHQCDIVQGQGEYYQVLGSRSLLEDSHASLHQNNVFEENASELQNFGTHVKYRLRQTSKNKQRNRLKERKFAEEVIARIETDEMPELTGKFHTRLDGTMSEEEIQKFLFPKKFISLAAHTNTHHRNLIETALTASHSSSDRDTPSRSGISSVEASKTPGSASDDEDGDTKSDSKKHKRGMQASYAVSASPTQEAAPRATARPPPGLTRPAAPFGPFDLDKQVFTSADRNLPDIPGDPIPGSRLAESNAWFRNDPRFQTEYYRKVEAAADAELNRRQALAKMSSTLAATTISETKSETAEAATANKKKDDLRWNSSMALGMLAHNIDQYILDGEKEKKGPFADWDDPPAHAIEPYKPGEVRSRFEHVRLGREYKKEDTSKKE